MPVPVQVEQRELIRAVFHFMQHRLTDEQRKVLILRFVEGFSLKETAHLTGKTENALSVVQNRALGKIRKALQVRFSMPRQLDLRAEMSRSAA